MKVEIGAQLSSIVCHDRFNLKTAWDLGSLAIVQDLQLDMQHTLPGSMIQTEQMQSMFVLEGGLQPQRNSA